VPAHQELATREPAPGEVVPVAEAEPAEAVEEESADGAVAVAEAETTDTAVEEVAAASGEDGAAE
jgi:hypothetical protein